MASKPDWIIIKRPTTLPPVTTFYVRKGKYIAEFPDATRFGFDAAWDRVLAEPEDVQIDLDVVRRSDFIKADAEISKTLGLTPKCSASCGVAPRTEQSRTATNINENSA